MVILDTSVLSEPLKSRPDPKVLAWLDAQAAETLFMSTISYAELLFGVLRMPDGKRKNDLAAQIERNRIPVRGLRRFSHRSEAQDIGRKVADAAPR